MDVLGLIYAEYSDAEREAVVHAHPRTAHFKEDIIQAFYDGFASFSVLKGNCYLRIAVAPALAPPSLSAEEQLATAILPKL